MSTSLTLAEFPLTQLTAIDLDDDDRDEVIGFDFFGDRFQIFRARESGRLTPYFVAPFSGSDIQQITTADINGDGREDLVGLSRTENVIQIFLNQGDGTLTQPAKAPLPAVIEARALTLHDFDADGHSDLVVAAPGSVFVYRNDGAGFFEFPQTIPLPPFQGTPTAIAFADLHGTGLADIAAIVGGDVIVFRNDGDNYVLERQVPAGGSEIIVIDADNDGDDDLVMPGGLTQSITTVSYTGTPPFLYDIKITGVPSSASGDVTDVAYGDINADGSLDFVFGSEDSLTPYILTNVPDEGRLFSVLEGPRGEFWDAQTVAIANIDADPLQELIYAANDQRQLVVLDPDASGSFASVGDHIPSDDVTYRSLRPFGQANGAPLFLLFHNSSSLPLRVVSASTSGAGTQLNVSEVPGLLRAPGLGDRCETGDINGDGLLDVIYLNTDTLSWNLAEPKGSYSAAQSMPLDAYGRTPPVVRDTNNDGRAEVLVLADTGVLWTIHFNADGSPSHTTQMQLTPPSLPGSLIVEDIDSDGHFDAAAVHQRGSLAGSIVVAFGNGDGSFTDPVVTPTSIAAGNQRQQNGLRCADLNEDGLKDFVVVANNAVFVHHGLSPRTWSAADRIADGLLTVEIEIVDMDNNGIPEVISLGSRNSTVLYQNPAGRFAGVERFAHANTPPSSLYADLNNDGLADLLYITNRGVSSVMNKSTPFRCIADHFPDGVLNFFDFAQIIDDVMSQSLDADLNADGSVNFFDIIAFLNAYNQGCP